MQKFEKREITKKSKDISRWYTDVVLKAKLADYGPARGTMVSDPMVMLFGSGSRKSLIK